MVMNKMIFSLMLASSMGIANAAHAQSADDTPPPSPTLGLNHIGLAVSDLEATATFFTDVLGFRRAGGDPDYPAIFVSNGQMFVTLWRVTDPTNSVAFDRKNNVGLHHMAITVRDLTTLEALHERFRTYPGVRIEFAPEFLGSGPTTHMIIRDPSGLRLEFIVPASRMSEEERARPNPRDAR